MNHSLLKGASVRPQRASSGRVLACVVDAGAWEEGGNPEMFGSWTRRDDAQMLFANQVMILQVFVSAASDVDFKD
jgi:hypothetical protein